MSQDSLFLIDVEESSDDVSLCSVDASLKNSDSSKIKVETNCLFEISKEVITIGTSDSEIDVEDVPKRKEEVAVFREEEMNSSNNNEMSEEEEEEQEKEGIFYFDDEDSRKVVSMKKEMETLFAVGTEFLDIDELRIRAQELGKKYNCPITTDKSSQKRQIITMICEHGKEYRSGKKVVEPTPAKDEVNKQYAKNTAKGGCCDKWE